MNLQSYPSSYNLEAGMVSQLKNYYNLLVAWNEKFNLIAPKQIASFDIFTDHHLVPCLWLGEVIKKDMGLKDKAVGENMLPSKTEAITQTSLPLNFIDLGSGNGLPAIPLAMMFQQPFVMVEKTNKKSVALQTMVADLHLQGKVVAKTITESLPTIIKQERPAFLTARALLPLPELLPLLSPLLSPLPSPLLATALPIYLLKGKKIHAEWQAVSKKEKWQMTILAENKVGGVVVRLQKK